MQIVAFAFLFQILLNIQNRTEQQQKMLQQLAAIQKKINTQATVITGNLAAQRTQVKACLIELYHSTCNFQDGGERLNFWCYPQ